MTPKKPMTDSTISKMTPKELSAELRKRFKVRNPAWAPARWAVYAFDMIRRLSRVGYQVVYGQDADERPCVWIEWGCVICRIGKERDPLIALCRATLKTLVAKERMR